MENLLFFGVPILKHVRVYGFLTCSSNAGAGAGYTFYPLSLATEQKDVHYVLLFTCLFESFAMILETKSRF